MPTPAPLLVVISGLPASGKSWLGSRLAPRLGLPYVTKDEYKELLHEGLPDLTQQRSGPLSFALMWQVAEVLLRAGVGCVLETHFYRGLSEPHILRLAETHRARLLQVFCSALPELLRERHAARVAEGLHPHIHRAGLWGAAVPPQACVVPLQLSAPLLQLDTSAENDDVARVAAWVREQIHLHRPDAEQT